MLFFVTYGLYFEGFCSTTSMSLTKMLSGTKLRDILQNNINFKLIAHIYFWGNLSFLKISLLSVSI